MTNKAATFILLLLFFSLFACKDTKHTPSIQTNIIELNDTIPLKLTDSNNWIMETIINGVDTLDLMFHTAATGVALKQSVIKDLQNISFDSSDTLTTWGGRHESRYSMNNTVQIGAHQWDSIMIIEDIHSGHGSDGKFGYDLFINKVVSLDFVNERMIISNELPILSEQFNQIGLIKGKPSPFMNALIEVGDSLFQNEFMLHSGYSGTLLLDDAFVQNAKINERLDVVGGRDLKDSFGNIIKTQKVLIPSLRITTEKFDDLAVEIFDVALGRQKLSVLGAAILSQFDLVFDFRYNQLHIRRNSLDLK